MKMMEESAHRSVASAVQETVRATMTGNQGKSAGSEGRFPVGITCPRPPPPPPHSHTLTPSGRSISVLAVVNKAILNAIIKKKK